MEVRTTQDGLLRAFGMLMQRAAQPRPIKKKYVYQPFGNAVHASRCLTKAESEAVDALFVTIKSLDPSKEENGEQLKSLFKELGKHPVKFVPLKAERRVDFSKRYPYRSKKRGG